MTTRGLTTAMAKHDKPRRLIPAMGCNPKALEDAIYITAFNVEDAMRTAGAVPGEDYRLLDLFRMAVPIVSQMMRDGAVQHYRLPTDKDEE